MTVNIQSHKTLWDDTTLSGEAWIKPIKNIMKWGDDDTGKMKCLKKIAMIAVLILGSPIWLFCAGIGIAGKFIASGSVIAEQVY